MNNQLLLGVLLVTLSWGFMGASAQSSSNSTSNVTSTSTTGPNTTISLSTNTSVVATATSTNSNNATSPTVSGTPNTTVTNQPSSNAATNAASNATASNATTSNAASNATASNATTSNTASNATASNATTSNTASNATASNATTTNSTTTNSTTAPVTTAFPVAALQTPITRTACGSTKLCAASPSTCDPSTGTGCYFISAQQQSGQLYNFELSGQTDGYIAAGVSTASNQNGTNQVYICLNNNSAVNFFTGTITNLLLSLTQLNANNVMGSVSSNKVQCTFAATLPDTTRSASYALSVSTGTYNNSSGTFGSPSFRIFTNQVNLSNPNSNVTNQISGAYPVAYQQPLIPALLVTVVMLTFSAL